MTAEICLQVLAANVGCCVILNMKSLEHDFNHDQGSHVLTIIETLSFPKTSHRKNLNPVVSSLWQHLKRRGVCPSRKRGGGRERRAIVQARVRASMRRTCPTVPPGSPRPSTAAAAPVETTAIRDGPNGREVSSLRPSLALGPAGLTKVQIDGPSVGRSLTSCVASP